MIKQPVVESSVKERLKDYFSKSSPEQYRAMEKLGLVTQTIDDVAAAATPGQQGAADVFTMLKDRLFEAVGGILSKSKPQVFSSDAAAWEGELSRYLASSGPEGFAEAVKLGRLEPHVRFLAAHARAMLSEELRSGAKESEASQKVRDWMLANASPVPAPASEWTALARTSRSLTYQQFEQVVQRYKLAPTGERSQIAHEVMSVLLERPDFGVLLATSAFSIRFEQEPAYQLCLGAWHFGSGRLDVAAETFREAVTLEASPMAFTCLANCLKAQGRLEEALRVLDEGLRQHPDERGLPNMAAGTAFALGDSSRANAYLAPHADEYFEHFPRREYIEMRRQELDQAIATGQLYRDEAKDLYDDAYARSTWWNYWYHFNSYTRYQHAEGVLADIVPDYLNEAIARLPVPPKAFVEIGTMCGEIVDRLASRYPQTSFFGVDRQQNVKALNDDTYRRDNLEFVADDIFAFMEQRREAVEGGMLFHVRTSPFLFPAFLEKLYRQSGEYGIKYIALFEMYTVSYSKRRFQTFSEMSEIAEIRGGGLIHHNYPRVFERAGFRVIHQQVARPTLLFSGMDNSVFLLAERI